MMNQHIIFYDGTCGFCHGVVKFLLKQDTKKQFLFAPLQGKTAEEKHLPWKNYKPDIDSIILLENASNPEKQQYFIYGKAALRIFWLLGGFFSLIGILNFLPFKLYDWAYRLFAKKRKQWFTSSECLIPKQLDKSRFLP